MDLPEKMFLQISTKTPLINVDLFIINEFDEILLSWRDDVYCGTGWHIPGGIIRHGETMQTRLQKTATKEIGFLPEFELTPCKVTEIFLKQKYRNHFISHLFRGWCSKDSVKTVIENIPHKIGDLCWFSYYPGLVFSQNAYEEYMIDYFNKLKL